MAWQGIRTFAAFLSAAIQTGRRGAAHLNGDSGNL
jgi:hypothetical protein